MTLEKKITMWTEEYHSNVIDTVSLDEYLYIMIGEDYLKSIG